MRVNLKKLKVNLKKLKVNLKKLRVNLKKLRVNLKKLRIVSPQHKFSARAAPVYISTFIHVLDPGISTRDARTSAKKAALCAKAATQAIVAPLTIDAPPAIATPPVYMRPKMACAIRPPSEYRMSYIWSLPELYQLINLSFYFAYDLCILHIDWKADLIKAASHKINFKSFFFNLFGWISILSHSVKAIIRYCAMAL